MRIPDLEAEIEEWENAHTYDVLEMRMISKDMLFMKDAKRMKQMVAAVYQVSDQYLGKSVMIADKNGEPPQWTGILRKANNRPRSI